MLLSLVHFPVNLSKENFLSFFCPSVMQSSFILITSCSFMILSEEKCFATEQHLILLVNDSCVMQVMRSLIFSKGPALHSSRYLIHHQSSSIVEVNPISYCCYIIKLCCFLYGLISFSPLGFTIVRFWSSSFQLLQLSPFSFLPLTIKSLHPYSI